MWTVLSSVTGAGSRGAPGLAAAPAAPPQSPPNTPRPRQPPLLQAIFPINYSDRMYQEILACGPVTQLAFHGEQLIGAIGCRLEDMREVQRGV